MTKGVESMLQTVLKGKAVPLQARSGPEGFRNLRFPDFMTAAQDGGKVVSLTHRPPLRKSLRNTGIDNSIYTALVRIMLTLMDYFSPADRRTPWVL